MSFFSKVFLITPIILTVTFVTLTGTGLCTPMTIQNPSFESPEDPNFTYTIDNWAIAGTAGVIHKRINPQRFIAPDGDQAAYLAYRGTSISQTLGDTLQNNTSYTLSYYVGYRSDYFSYADYNVALYAGTTLLALDNNVKQPTPGNFLSNSITYESLADDPSYGQALKIVFRNVESSSGNYQVLFDMVTLDATPVPLPGALLLLGGMLRLVSYLRKRSLDELS